MATITKITSLKELNMIKPKTKYVHCDNVVNSFCGAIMVKNYERHANAYHSSEIKCKYHSNYNAKTNTFTTIPRFQVFLSLKPTK